MDAWPTRKKEKKEEPTKVSGITTSSVVYTPRTLNRPKQDFVDTLGIGSNQKYESAKSIFEESSFSSFLNAPSSSTPRSMNHKTKGSSILRQTDSFLSSQTIQTSVRKVYHERISMEPTPTRIESSIKPVNKPPSQPESSSTQSLRASTPDKDTSVTAPTTVGNNFVRLNLKRRLNVKHHIHHKQAKPSSKDKEEDMSIQQRQEQSGTGPGMLEDEIVSMYLQSKQTKTPPKQSDMITVPLCNHGIPSVCRKVKKAGKNHGREFYCCPHDYSSSCGFFLWKENNRNDVISLISSIVSSPTPSTSHKDMKERLKHYTQEQLKDYTVENLRVISRMMQIKWKSNKADSCEAIVDRTMVLYDQLHEWKESMELDEESTLSTIAYEVFNIKEFNEGQMEVIHKCCSFQDILFISPTGSGKSLTYQIPTLLHEGITLVISPLIALMQDQSKQLPTLLPSLVLSGVLEPRSLIHMTELITSNLIKVIFISPERLFSSLFKQLLKETDLASRIKMVVVDEAHCISSWSFNFRADYLRIYRVIERIREVDKGHPCSVLCLTATGGKLVTEDICKQLHIQEGNVIDNGWFRKEIQFASVTCSQPTGCQNVLLQFLKSSYFSKADTKQNVIVFVPFRRDTVSLCDYLQSYNYDCSVYHGGLNISARKKSLKTFTHSSQSLHIIIATSAFGLGVNLPNITSVVHMYAIRSVQEYIQQVGRYRGSNQGALCLSILCDSVFSKLYSMSFSTVFSSKAITRFLQSIEKDAIDSVTAISFQQNEQQFNLPESLQRTLLILLENQGFIRLDSEFNNHYTISPYNSTEVCQYYELFIELMQTSSFYQSLFQFASNYDPNTNTFDFELMPFSRFIKQSIIQVKSQLRKLETAHAILVKTEELSILLEVLKPITEEVIQSIIEMVECRQKEEVEELKRVYYLQSVLQLNTKDDCDDNTSTTMKLINQHYSSEDNHDKPVVCLESPNQQFEELISTYFQNYKDLVVDLSHNGELKLPNHTLTVTWPIRHVDDSTQVKVIRSAKMLLRDDRIHVSFLTGLTFAKIWHSISSPVFSSEVWSSSEQWGLFSLYDFEELVDLADRTIREVISTD